MYVKRSVKAGSHYHHCRHHCHYYRCSITFNFVSTLVRATGETQNTFSALKKLPSWLEREYTPAGGGSPIAEAKDGTGPSVGWAIRVEGSVEDVLHRLRYPETSFQE